MKIGMIGLGRMGGNMAQRLLAAGDSYYKDDLRRARQLTADGIRP